MKKVDIFVFYYIEIIILELLFKYLLVKNILNIGLLYIFVFTIPIALFLTLITSVFKNKKVNNIFSIILSFLITLLYIFQYLFKELLSVPFSFYSLNRIDQAFDFTSIIKGIIISKINIIIILLIPFIISLLLIKFKNNNRHNKYQNITLLILIVMSIFIEQIYLIPNKDKESSAYELYYKTDDSINQIDRFGLLTYMEIDVKRVLFGYEAPLIEKAPAKVELINTPTEIKYKDNIEDINFESLINSTDDKTLKSMHSYFNSSIPTTQNEYTGLFKDKNLIFILAEGFNEVAVDEQRTPTLYKMIHEGFNFTNFYSPVFLSTTGGEFQATTGLIPTQGVLGSWYKNNNQMQYSLGYSFKDYGYSVQSYHDWTYTYYDRDKTMKTLGFDNYMGCGNGMEKLLKCEWLPLDTDMMKQTPSLYTNEDKFVTYYVTVSGHSPYVRGANIVNKHYDTVKDLNISQNIKNYLSSQVELDKALEVLINELTTSGRLEDTVIALVGDHYPYTLSSDEVSEAASYKKDEIVEVNHSNFIIWNSNMEPVTINKTGSQIDVLPTLLNLFDIKYDSRLIVGKDILSTYEGLAMFSNRSWVTDKGTYYATSKKFVPKDGIVVENDYVDRINQRVSESFAMSKLIMDTNYYQKVRGSK